MATSRSRQQQQPSRLQRRAPSSININPPVKEWNIAIPLLSPLTSPVDRSIADMQQQQNQNQNQNQNQLAGVEEQKQPQPVVFKKWQHPAAPFGYEPTTTTRSSCIRL